VNDLSVCLFELELVFAKGRADALDISRAWPKVPAVNRYGHSGWIGDHLGVGDAPDNEENNRDGDKAGRFAHGPT